MTPLRRRKIVAALLKLIRRSQSRSFFDGPGCTCESCVQAWDRHHPAGHKPAKKSRRLRPGLY